MFSTQEANRANYATAGISLVILLARILVGRWRGRPLDLAFYLLLLSIVAITCRITQNWYYLHLGTTNDAFGNPKFFETHKPSDVVKGSKILLGARAALTCSLWLQIFLLLLFYSQIMQGIRWVKIVIRMTWIVALATFIAVNLLTILECRPLHLYWQITPNPGRCIKAYAQLLSQCVCNVFLDLMLLTISLPVLYHRGRTWTQHLRVGGLFMLGTFCIVVTIMRLIAVYGDNGEQAARTLWGAVQIIVSTFVANAPTIYGDIKVMRRRGRERRERRLSRPESWTRTSIDEEAGLEETPPDNGLPRKSWELRQAQKRDQTYSEEPPQVLTVLHTIDDGTQNYHGRPA